ncbi:uncharacterized protein LOC122702570 [Cervus elaphus]|uniref:uncharacterized protein LOC122702570 n=1 Tax=Cervus elaphus TaxID=9860 RepID=UPI001CC27DC7|nr:uncharacterized protein LOC122702570 [Cervus elaphus]
MLPRRAQNFCSSCNTVERAVGVWRILFLRGLSEGAHGLEGRVDESRRASPRERRARAPGNGVRVLGEGREPWGAHKAPRDTGAETRKTGAASPTCSERARPPAAGGPSAAQRQSLREGKEHPAPTVRATITPFSSVANRVITTCLGDRSVSARHRARASHERAQESLSSSGSFLFLENCVCSLPASHCGCWEQASKCFAEASSCCPAAHGRQVPPYRRRRGGRARIAPTPGAAGRRSQQGSSARPAGATRAVRPGGSARWRCGAGELGKGAGWASRAAVHAIKGAARARASFSGGEDGEVGGSSLWPRREAARPSAPGPACGQAPRPASPPGVLSAVSRLGSLGNMARQRGFNGACLGPRTPRGYRVRSGSRWAVAPWRSDQQERWEGR